MRIIPNRYSYKYKKVNEIFLEHVSTVPLSSSVPIYTKYKVEYKVLKHLSEHGFKNVVYFLKFVTYMLLSRLR